MITIIENIYKLWIPLIFRTFGLYFVWIIIHYLSAHLYILWCVPNNFTGVLSSFILAPSPHCSALRWTIYNGGNSMETIWIILGLWIMTYLSPIKI